MHVFSKIRPDRQLVKGQEKKKYIMSNVHNNMVATTMLQLSLFLWFVICLELLFDTCASLMIL